MSVQCQHTANQLDFYLKNRWAFVNTGTQWCTLEPIKHTEPRGQGHSSAHHCFMEDEVYHPLSQVAASNRSSHMVVTSSIFPFSSVNPSAAVVFCSASSENSSASLLPLPTLHHHTGNGLANTGWGVHQPFLPHCRQSYIHWTICSTYPSITMPCIATPWCLWRTQYITFYLLPSFGQ